MITVYLLYYGVSLMRLYMCSDFQSSKRGTWFIRLKMARLRLSGCRVFAWAFIPTPWWSQFEFYVHF
jgi:hypothetical protein